MATIPTPPDPPTHPTSLEVAVQEAANQQTSVSQTDFELRVEFPLKPNTQQFNVYEETKKVFSKMFQTVKETSIVNHTKSQSINDIKDFPSAEEFTTYFHYEDSKLIRSKPSVCVLVTLRSPNTLQDIKRNNKIFSPGLKCKTFTPFNTSSSARESRTSAYSSTCIPTSTGAQT
jgi:hypothetical protein